MNKSSNRYAEIEVMDVHVDKPTTQTSHATKAVRTRSIGPYLLSSFFGLI